MIKKGFKHTQETKDKIRLSKLGKKLSKEHRKKISESRIGKTGSNKGKHWKIKDKSNMIGKSGEKNGFYGKHHSEETKAKLSISHLKNPSRYWLGKKRPSLSEETKKKMSKSISGKNHWNWQNGKSLEPYSIDWTITLKISIRERDKYTCQICGEKQNEKAFSIHHIDYDKKNCNPINLITLCKKCHAKTNFNRDKWIQYFKSF